MAKSDEVDAIGVGIETAATLLVTAGDNSNRLHSEAAFAHLCGSAPIDASSGLIKRKRLNPRGDRLANEALWRIVMVRMSSEPEHAPTFNAAPPKEKPNEKSSAASNATSHETSSKTSNKTLDNQ